MTTAPAPSSSPPSVNRPDRVRFRTSQLAAKIAVSVVAIVFAALAAEVFLRMFVEQETKRLAVYDDELGWRGRPHGQGVYIRRKDDIRVPFAYNNHGFRDENITPKLPDAHRILMLGDSFLENLEVRFQDVFHERLEEHLDQVVDSRTDIVALGSQGYSNAQELLAFRRFKDVVNADIVLSIFYSGNDFRDNSNKRFAYLDDDGTLIFPRNTDPVWKVRTKQFQRRLYESSHLVFLLKNRFESWSKVKLSDPSKATGSKKDDDYQSAITLRLLGQTKAEVEATGAEYAIILMPSREELREGDLSKIELVAAFCNSHSIPYLDLAQVLQVSDYFQTDIHLTPEGHRRVAKELFDFLVEAFGHYPWANPP